ncbi:MAG: Serine/threonine kinase [Labilithrix sp.]|nr:Serine/threonine kinase [Labilithrix sp.]
MPDGRTLRSGRYTLIRTLGSGSQAETFEARDNGVGTEAPAPGQLSENFARYVARARRGDEAPGAGGRVAIKSFHVGRAKAWKDVELAEREASTLASLRHPNLPRYLEHFEEDGALYLVMEMVEGDNLASLRAQGRISSVVEVTRMLADIGEALRYLHGRAPAVVHRDIKPGNVIRRLDGSYALVDFGAVRDRLKPEGGSTVVGTFGFMAPEQFQGRASPRSDLYGLAATALVMLTGMQPEDLPHVGLGIDVQRALPSSTPAPLVRALSAMLDPDPDRRAASIDVALALLRPGAPAVPGPRRQDRWDEKRRDRKGRAHEKREAMLARRNAKRSRRRARHARAAPFVVRIVGQIALMFAQIVVGLAVGVALPLVLTLLSLVFGETLRRAARAARRGAHDATSAMDRASAFLGGARGDDDEAHVRVEAGDEARVRVRADEASERELLVDEHDEEPEPRQRRRER